ncbi:prophage tail fiber N-terminal domain-containing protein [Enterobacter sp. A103]|uniref:prophage tail fiber N-terminal domain-containing protein n=1 Tax=Enterobacter sp. A103 TaxID=3102785 RepID=UPI002ACAF76A|nr:prophage tail fiber N-terminal domain-containing protein [Enterobacter sp. A103]MDZ5641667.1 prophage tail fiber N-terminal domain-containing protein [Enterobacter sp. A103]
MPVKISGVLKDAVGKPIPDCIIRLTATGTTQTVIVTTRGETAPDSAGSYSMDVEPGDYRVTLVIPGWPPQEVGKIEVRSYSAPGTLNDFLTKIKSADLDENLMARFEKLAADIALDRQRAESSATAAADSKTAAKTSEDNAAASASAAAGSKTAAKTSEDNAAASATAAADSKTAANTSEDNAAASASAAAGSKTAAKTSEDNAAASATAAADSKTAAKTSEDNAAASASAAAGSKAAAKTSEDNAAVSATAAGTSEANAHASELLAAQHAADAQGAAAGSGRLIAFKKMEVSGKYVPSPGTTRIIFEVQAAGGSDYTQDNRPDTLSTPASSGAYARVMVTEPDIEAEYDVQTGAAVTGKNGGDTLIEPVIMVEGGRVSRVVSFDGAVPPAPVILHADTGPGFGWLGPGEKFTLLAHSAPFMFITWLIPAGGDAAVMQATGGETPLGSTPPVMNITQAAFYQSARGYGAGSPGYNPALKGIDEGVRAGRPGVVYIWEYS